MAIQNTKYKHQPELEKPRAVSTLYTKIKTKQMNKYISLTLAILNTVMFGLYFTQPSTVELYEWITTPLFAALFIKIYITERNKTK